MLTIISEKGTQRISTENIQLLNTELSQFTSNNRLALLITFPPGAYFIAVTSPLLIGSAYLNNKILITAGVLRDSVLNDGSFGPLISEVKDMPVSHLSSEEIILLCYFYLNTMPFSISIISNYFSEVGTNPDKALLLAEAVYIARTNRDETEPWFMSQSDCINSQMSYHFIDNQLYYIPVTLDKAFTLQSEKEELQFVFDSLPVDSPANSKITPIVNLERINESGFLIEDHAIIIIGLSLSITELVKISEDKWPMFNMKLLSTIPLYFRDFYSLGKLINVQPEIIQILTSEYHCKTDIISVSVDGRKHFSPINGQRSEFTKSNLTKGIPLFMQILK
jgi:hypothetical protein